MIKPLALAVAAVLTLVATPLWAQAYGSSQSSSNVSAPTPDSRPGKEKVDLKIEKAQHDQGIKEVPAVVAAAGVPCTFTDGYFGGAGDSKDADGKAIKVKIYEAACKEGLGYMIVVPAAGPAKHYDCVSLIDAPGLKCRLPANLDAKVQLAPIIAKTGRTCTLANARGLGATAAGEAFYEVACQGAVGFVLKTTANGPEAIDCARTVGTNLECKFTSKDQLAAQQKATLQALMARSSKPCEITGSRTLGADATGNTYYEVACGASGYVLEADKTGAFMRTIDCANAGTFAGGCKLTDAVAAESQEAGTYTKLATTAGFNCQVSKYRFIGTVNKNDELVELACSNRADGAFAIFPDAKNTPATFYDCVRAGAVGQECKLSSPAVVYDKYTAALAAKGKNTCKVSNATWIGQSNATNTDFVEAACADGLPGWVLEMTKAGQAKTILSCGEAKASGIVCKLPGNVK